MPCFEFEGKSVEKAVQRASNELNIPKDKLKHDVLSYGSTGIFGLVGTKKARIRVTLPEGAAKSRPPKENKPRVAPDPPAPEAPAAEPAPAAAAADQCVIVPDAADPANIGSQALQRLVDVITSGASVTVDQDAERMVFNVTGGNTAVLIGKRGQTLEALQYLIEKMVNKNREPRLRVMVDVEDYLKNRRLHLESLAERLATKVARTGKPATIGQMNAHDRRIVHLVLKDNPAVRTQSMGNGYLRKLMVFPRKAPAGRKDANG